MQVRPECVPFHVDRGCPQILRTAWQLGFSHVEGGLQDVPHTHTHTHTHIYIYIYIYIILRSGSMIQKGPDCLAAFVQDR